jgi:hypothetical protein
MKSQAAGSSKTILRGKLASGIIGLIGGYMLRHVVVYGGTRIALDVQGQPVQPPPEKYETKVIESAYQTLQKV